MGGDGNINTAQRPTGNGWAAKRGAGRSGAGPRLTAPRCSARNKFRSEKRAFVLRGDTDWDGLPGSETAGRGQRARLADMTGSLHASDARYSQVRSSIRLGGPASNVAALESNAREPAQLGPNHKRDSALLANSDPGTDSVPRAPRHVTTLCDATGKSRRCCG